MQYTGEETSTPPIVIRALESNPLREGERNFTSPVPTVPVAVLILWTRPETTRVLRSIIAPTLVLISKRHTRLPDDPEP